MRRVSPSEPKDGLSGWTPWASPASEGTVSAGESLTSSFPQRSEKRTGLEARHASLSSLSLLSKSLDLLGSVSLTIKWDSNPFPTCLKEL